MITSSKNLGVDYKLRQTWLIVAKMFNEEANKYNSTMAAGFALLSIDPKKGTPSTTLGPKMGMEKTSISRILKNLEAKNLIIREANPTDRRGVIIKLTKKGLEMRDLSKKSVSQFNQSITKSISKEKLDNFYEVLNEINDLIINKKIFN